MPLCLLLLTLPLLLPALAVTADNGDAAAALLCPKALPPEKCQRIGAGDYHQFPAANHSVCAAACCADVRCGSWNWDASMSVPATMPPCRVGGKSVPCCYLKGGALENCTGKATSNDPAAWSGLVRPGKPVPPPAPAPAPPPPRAHSSAGTPDGMSASFDCEARNYAWEFGKATLPRHGTFKTLYDALQLQHCAGIAPTPPTVEDTFVPTHFPPPEQGHVIYADATAPIGGDGTKGRPFSTLEAGLAAAAARNAPNTTLLLRKGAKNGIFF